MCINQTEAICLLPSIYIAKSNTRSSLGFTEVNLRRKMQNAPVYRRSRVLLSESLHEIIWHQSPLWLLCSLIHIIAMCICYYVVRSLSNLSSTLQNVIQNAQTVTYTSRVPLKHFCHVVIPFLLNLLNSSPLQPTT